MLQVQRREAERQQSTWKSRKAPDSVTCRYGGTSSLVGSPASLQIRGRPERGQYLPRRGELASHLSKAFCRHPRHHHIRDLLQCKVVRNQTRSSPDHAAASPLESKADAVKMPRYQQRLLLLTFSTRQPHRGFDASEGGAPVLAANAKTRRQRSLCARRSLVPLWPPVQLCGRSPGVKGLLLARKSSKVTRFRPSAYSSPQGGSDSLGDR